MSSRLHDAGRVTDRCLGRCPVGKPVRMRTQTSNGRREHLIAWIDPSVTMPILPL